MGSPARALPPATVRPANDTAPPAVDPALLPTLDALAYLLVANLKRDRAKSRP